MNFTAFQAALVGHPIRRLVALEYWCDGQLVDRFNVFFVAVGNQWLRFFIDASVFFWRMEAAPDAPTADGSHAWTLAEYPFVGTVKEVVFASPAADALSLRIVLSDDRVLCLNDEADHTTVVFLPSDTTLQRMAFGCR